MSVAMVIAAELESRGFTAGLIRGFFEDGGEKWSREMRRCRNDGDAADLAKDIASALELRRGSKLRAHDFWCGECRSNFEEYLSYNPYDLDELEAARSGERPCPTCGASSRSVTLRAPGMHVAQWAMQFGGHTYDKDDFDQRVDSMFKPKKEQRFFNDPNFTERFLGDFEETAIKTMAGDEPPSPPIDPVVAGEIAAVIKTGV
jgi:hypothetical protein